MRRTDQEFRDELLRRAREHRTRQRQRRRKLLGAAVCVILMVFGSAMTLPFLGGMGAGAGNAASMAAAPEGAVYDCPAEEPAAVEGRAEYAWDLIPMVMVDGILYLDTGYYNGDTRKCGTFDGEITSEVDGSLIPSENDQSNFGAGYGYQYGTLDGTVEIFMNGKWRIFATEDAMTQMEHQE